MADRLDGESITITRRETLHGGAVASIALAAPFAPAAAQLPVIERSSAMEHGFSLSLAARINGEPVSIEIDARSSLLDVLRERLGLTGAKKGCDHGQCGACTVHLDGRRVASCLTLAVKVDGREVVTIEGIADGDRLHPMQQAFIDHDALQCGYCTPGQIMAAIACVKEGHASSREEIREYMSGNICRCGAYVGIVAAIEQASTKIRRA